MKAEETIKLIEEAISLLNFAHNKRKKHYTLSIKHSVGIYGLRINYKDTPFIVDHVRYDNTETSDKLIKIIENFLTKNLLSMVAGGLYHTKEFVESRNKEHTITTENYGKTKKSTTPS